MNISRHSLTLLGLAWVFVLVVGCGGTHNAGTGLRTSEVSVGTPKSVNSRSGSGSSIPSNRPDDSVHPVAFGFFVNGTILEANGEYAAAAEQYKRALQYHPNSHEIRFSFAMMLYRLGMFADVVEALRVITPEDGQVQRLRASCFRELDDADSAAFYYRLSVTSDSLQTTPYAFLASFYQQQGSADSAIWAYENLSRLRPDDYGVWYELGELHARQGRFLEAQQAVREALSLRPDGENLMAYVRMGELYEQRQIPDSAILMFKTAHTFAPDNLILNRLLTSYYVATDSFDLALPHAQAVVRTAPMERAGCRRLALIYYVLDSLTLADSILTSLVEGGDEDPVNHAYLGRIAAQREDYSTAREQFQKALSLADSVSDAYLDLGYAMNRLGQVDGEVSMYQSGLLKVTDSLGTVRLLMALASVLERSGRGDESIPVLERLLKAAPNDAAGLNFLGYLLAERGQRLEYAKELIERAVAQEPTNAAFLDSYGWVYYRLREFDSALVYLKQAAELDNDPTILDHLGDAYEATGNRILALDCWRRALDLAPDNEAIKQKIGE